jgi:hypothetical protein
MASTSKEEKPTAPLLPAVQPAPLSTAVQPAVQFAAVQQVNKLDIAQRHEQTLAIFAPHKEEWVRAYSVALVLYFFQYRSARHVLCIIRIFIYFV